MSNTAFAVVEWVRRHLLAVTAVVLVAIVLSIELAFVTAAWPTGWKAAAQASLAGVLIASAVSALSVLVKAAFDQITVNTQHRLGVRSKILEAAYTYAGYHLVPLAGVAQELGKYLREYGKAMEQLKKAEEEAADKAKKNAVEKARRALDGAFYSTAQYVKLEAAVKATIPLPGVDRPLGVFLKSRAREDRVWRVMLPAWALGIISLEQESVLIRSLTEKNPVTGLKSELVPPAVFIRQSHDENHPLFELRERFDEEISSHEHLNHLKDVLTVFGELMNYEVRSMFDAWYTEAQPEPRESLEKLQLIPQEVRKDVLGIFYAAPVGDGGPPAE